MSAHRVTDEQRELVESFLRPLDTLLPLGRLNDSAAAGDDAKWSELAELGLLAAAVSEAIGGAGLGAVECALMAEHLGRCLASPTLIATMIAAPLIEHTLPALAKDLATGQARAAFGFRQAGGLIAADAHNAQLLVVMSEDHIAIHECRERDPSFEEAWTLWSSTLAPARSFKTILTTQNKSHLATAQLLLAAQASGIAAGARDAGVDYAKSRQQFGQAIGAFQAIKHRCADMAMQALAASDLVSFASIAVAEQRPDAPFLAASALNVALRGALRNAEANIQIHAGMGFSQECAANHYLKRTRVLEAVSGQLSAVRRRLLAAQFSLAG